MVSYLSFTVPRQTTEKKEIDTAKQIISFKDQSDQRTGSNGCRTDAERTENMQKILVR